MSADIMPCGCEGHFDNLELCQYPAVMDDLRAYFAEAPHPSAPEYFAWAKSQREAADRLRARVKSHQQLTETECNCGGPECGGCYPSAH